MKKTREDREDRDVDRRQLEGGRADDLTERVTDHVSGAADGVQERLAEALVDLGAQPRDVHVDDVGLRIEVIVPDVLEQHGAGHHLAGVLHQIFEQAELARLQRDRLAAARDRVAEPVELEVADAEHGLCGVGLPPPGKRLDAGEQLGEGVGLGQIVVAAGAQARDAVVDLAEGGEDQRRRVVALAAQFLDDRQAVALRQHAVDDQHVVAAIRRHRRTGIAVGGVVGHVSRLAQRLGKVGRGFLVVLDQKYPHGVTIH